MSLISDALKTAQSQRPAHGSGPDGQPLLDGFFPYVSTTSPGSRSNRTRLIVVSGASLVLLVGAAWVAIPAIRRASANRPAQNIPILLPPRQVAQTPAAPQQPAPVAVDTQPVTVAETPRSAPSIVPERASRTLPPAGRAVVRSADPTSARGDTAVALPRAAVESAPAPPARSPSVDYEAQATALFNAGDFEGARNRFQLATRQAPTARAWTNYGVTLQKLGELSAASAAYEAAMGIDGNYLEAWLYLGRLSVLLGESHKAIPLFQRALAINPRHSEVNAELADLEFKSMNWTETRRFAEEAVRGDPSNARAHYLLAIASDMLKDNEVAAREYAAYLQTIGAAAKNDPRSVGYAQRRLQELRKP